MSTSPAPCTTNVDLFQLLEDLAGIGVGDAMLEGPQLAMFSEEEADFREALSQARELCASCPLLEECLFTAVTDHAVKGIVAGTTESDREQLRSRLGLKPFKLDASDSDIYLLGRRTYDAVDPDRITAMTEAGQMTQSEIAEQLGCSTRTVRRRQRSACNVRRQTRSNPLTSKRVLDAAEQLLPWF
ncbi:WhiB family transcriptional regulator [Streptomyces goshikiensis]|uniref:WhiB family transcriptional regulator n=1 Tax=Streptomyces goshikiensis TaxID=1942 RepID=UPI0036BC2F9B